MPGQQKRPNQPMAESQDLAAEGEAQDYGSNDAMQDAMLGMDASGSGPKKFRIQEANASGDDMTMKVLGSAKHGISIGDKVTVGVNKGAVQKVFAHRSTVLMYSWVGGPPSGMATVHRGTKYSRSKFERDQKRDAKKQGDDESRRDRDREYSDKNRGGE
ncbi:MAG: hypothetical protein JRI25_07665 [Deltaproteobacteria bacterium]|nr:hypothetical protein [Deltaproteobacteria bacterium]MBW2254459.1 hypothetical protein [Deltaproteobacteria bacterium]